MDSTLFQSHCLLPVKAKPKNCYLLQFLYFSLLLVYHFEVRGPEILCKLEDEYFKFFGFLQKL